MIVIGLPLYDSCMNAHASLMPASLMQKLVFVGLELHYIHVHIHISLLSS